MITLNCGVRGDAPDHIFRVQIDHSEVVATLKEVIKEKGKPRFDHVPAHELNLWRVSIPTASFKEKVQEFTWSKGDLLLPLEDLAEVFPDTPQKRHVHIVVSAPPSLPLLPSTSANLQPSILVLNCYVRGDEPNRVFTVKINLSETISILKKSIKEEKRPAFDHVPADQLDLWMVSIPDNPSLKDKVEELMSTGGGFALLSSTKALANVFPNGSEEGHIQVIIQAPPAFDNALTHTLQGQDTLSNRRATYLKKFPKKPPSLLAQPSEIKKLQTSTDDQPAHFVCHRPPSAGAPIPITLLHPVFNEFKDDCKTHQPTREDNQLALELSTAMSCFFKDEKERQAAFIRILTVHSMRISATRIIGTDYYTDGDMREGDFPYFIAELKLEMGSGQAEPVFQAASHYTAHLQNQEKLNQDFRYPCLVLYLAGSTFGFAGLAFTERVHIEVLGPPTRFDYHPMDDELSTMVARYLGAMKKTTKRLKHCYKSEVTDFDATQPNTGMAASFPCYTRYSCLTDSVERDIEYTHQFPDDKLLFFGKSDGTEVCVKFVTRYSKEAHSHCALQGIAPKLKGFEALPGGWFMVVMERIAPDFVYIEPASRTETAKSRQLYEMVLNEIMLLHKAGYVHGDLRDANLLVRGDSKPEVMLLDFDWAGKSGQVRYPRNVNKGRELWRPDGAYDGELITAKHDIDMIKHMFQAD